MGYNRIAYAPGSRQNDDGVMDVLLPGTATQHMVREIYWKRVMYVYIIAHVAHAGIYAQRMCVFAWELVMLSCSILPLLPLPSYL